MKPHFEIIHEDADLLVINKPAGLVCHPTKTDEMSSLIGRLRLYLGPEARPHLINRLDRETSGVVVVAKQDAVARELRRLWENRQVEKEYLAIVHGHVRENEGFIDAPLGKDIHSRIAVKDCVRDDGSPSQTRFWVENRFAREMAAWRSVVFAAFEPPAAQFAQEAARAFSLLRVQPFTGRKHQIRIHLSHIGHPIVGDKLYGGDEDMYLALVQDRLTSGQRQALIFPNQALHARSIRFQWRGKDIEFRSEPEERFSAFAHSAGEAARQE